VLRTIVEGEPGIFPDPVARAMRKIGGLFDRKRPAATDQPADAGADQPGTDSPTAASATEQPVAGAPAAERSEDEDDKGGEGEAR
jgi:hypothetical protein